MVLAAHASTSVSPWTLIAVAVLGFGVAAVRIAMAFRMGRGNRRAGRPWWRGNGRAAGEQPPVSRSLVVALWVWFGIVLAVNGWTDSRLGRRGIFAGVLLGFLAVLALILAVGETRRYRHLPR